jgi:hypothetical protein
MHGLQLGWFVSRSGWCVLISSTCSWLALLHRAMSWLCGAQVMIPKQTVEVWGGTAAAEVQHFTCASCSCE